MEKYCLYRFTCAVHWNGVRWFCFSKKKKNPQTIIEVIKIFSYNSLIIKKLIKNKCVFSEILSTVNDYIVVKDRFFKVGNVRASVFYPFKL